jgi:NADH:ubiquinone oxidoreductase subunit D
MSSTISMCLSARVAIVMTVTLVRIEEVRQSIRIVNQVIKKLSFRGLWYAEDAKKDICSA